MPYDERLLSYEVSYCYHHHKNPSSREGYHKDLTRALNKIQVHIRTYPQDVS